LIYTATITSGALRLRESRVIAGLLLEQAPPATWERVLHTENAFQARSPESVRRVSRLLRARLSPLDAGLLMLVDGGDREEAVQVLLAASVKHSRLLGDFMDIVLREQWSAFERHLDKHHWEDYLAGCRTRDPDMPHWSESTRLRLRSSVYSILAEAGYLENTRSLALRRVFVPAEVKRLLEEAGERYALRCLEVTT
jgi:hypothetical protein